MSPLLLFTHLTSTSPCIREILTMDGGLERLLHDFCAHPPSPESAAQFYGLLPPPRPHTHTPLPPPAPPDPKRPFDCMATYRFSPTLQCIVNVGVRGSEPIPARIVQAGTLDVVGCMLEAWLASKGFAVAPSASASGMPRETRKQRHARRMALADVRQREVQAVQAEELARALHRQVAGMRRGQDQDQDQDEEMRDGEQDLDQDQDAASTRALRSSDTSNDTSPTETPHGGSTPTRAAPVPAAIHARDRSGTVGGGRAGEVDCPATNASKVQAQRGELLIFDTLRNSLRHAAHQFVLLLIATPLSISQYTISQYSGQKLIISLSQPLLMKSGVW
ncbi:hypothetical protein JB92DRAFT_3119287 [Gautieria morchelliformis]|nr:hypothetical protein JB92DRAFT_3119287 [Gautieria morchelliformis]